MFYLIVAIFELFLFFFYKAFMILAICFPPLLEQTYTLKKENCLLLQFDIKAFLLSKYNLHTGLQLLV